MPPEEQPAAEAEVSDDLHSLISKAFDEHEIPPIQPAAAEKPPETRERGPDGKFVKAEAEEPAEPVAPVEKPEAEEPTAEKPEKPATSEPPPTWKAEDKETFKALPPEAQQFLLRRHGEMEADYTRKTQQHAAFVRDYDPIRQHFAPFEPQIRQAGLTPLKLIEGWSHAEQALQDPQRAVPLLVDVVGRYGIDKSKLAQALGLTGAGGSGGAGTEAPPPVANSQQPIVLPPEVQQELKVLRQGHEQVTQFLTTQQQQQQREAENRVMSMIEAFKGAKDPSGNLLHPHYDELEADMSDLWKIAVAAGQQPTLEDVYDKAVWANTSTRQKLLDAQTAAQEAQRAAAEKKQRDEARAKAERAKRASSSVTGAPGSSQARMQPGPGERSLRDELNAAAEELSDA